MRIFEILMRQHFDLNTGGAAHDITTLCGPHLLPSKILSLLNGLVVAPKGWLSHSTIAYVTPGPRWAFGHGTAMQFICLLQ